MSPVKPYPRSWRLELPHWVAAIVAAQPPPYPDDDARMALAIALARGNVDGVAGGPFGAAVCDRDSGALVAAGVNCAFACNASVAHAEIVALTLAQQATGLLDLGQRPSLGLYTSAEPCAMCLGAIPWSGIRFVAIGARDADIRAVGFDEGAKPPGWVEALHARGVVTKRDLRRAEARQVLQDYAGAGGNLYGPDSAGPTVD